jgi:hypothetical protein
VGALELQVAEDVVFAHFLPANAGPNSSGYLGRVYPGGHFKGVGFDELRVLGTGWHSVAIDERVLSEGGREPECESEWRRLFEQFRFALFMYGVGACVAHEVLAAAREVVRLESQQQRHAEPGAAADPASWLVCHRSPRDSVAHSCPGGAAELDRSAASAPGVEARPEPAQVPLGSLLHPPPAGVTLGRGDAPARAVTGRGGSRDSQHSDVA